MSPLFRRRRRDEADEVEEGSPLAVAFTATMTRSQGPISSAVAWAWTLRMAIFSIGVLTRMPRARRAARPLRTRKCTSSPALMRRAP